MQIINLYLNPYPERVGLVEATQFSLLLLIPPFQVVMNHKLDKETPRFDIQLLFNEIGVALDDNQYRDVIHLVDMYHVYMRQHQVRDFPCCWLVLNTIAVSQIPTSRRRIRRKSRKS